MAHSGTSGFGCPNITNTVKVYGKSSLCKKLAVQKAEIRYLLWYVMLFLLARTSQLGVNFAYWLTDWTGLLQIGHMNTALRMTQNQTRQPAWCYPFQPPARCYPFQLLMGIIHLLCTLKHLYNLCVSSPEYLSIYEWCHKRLYNIGK